MKKHIVIFVIYLWILLLFLMLSVGIPLVLLRNYEKVEHANALIKVPLYHSHNSLNCMSLEERLVEEEKYGPPVSYAMFTWRGFSIRLTSYVIGDHSSPEFVWDRWEEVVFGNAVQVFCGELCVVEDILVCTAAGDDVHIVYYQTTKGNFVRLYPDNYISDNLGQYEYVENNAVYEMTEADFRDVSIARKAYIASSADYPGTLEYLEEYYPEMLQPQKFRIVQCYWIYRILAVLWIAGGITAVVIYNKRKNRPAADALAADGPAPDSDPDAPAPDNTGTPPSAT